MTKFSLPNLRVLPFGGAGAIDDPIMRGTVNSLNKTALEFLEDESVTQNFLTRYQQWITESRTNAWTGLEDFNQAVYTNATTEAFDKFYMKNSQRRFRCFRGEYMYHQLTWRNCWPNWSYLDDAPLEANDAVVVSSPFADTGGIHPRYHEILSRATELGVPVLVDHAYFGICYDLAFDVSYPCITDLTFSLSKTFPVAHSRIGMRLTKEDNDDPLFVLNKTNYTNRIGAGIGLALIEQYGPDYIANVYRSIQQSFCNQLQAEPSHCVIFGLGDQRWQQYNRGTTTNRLSLFRYLHNGKLPLTTT